MASNLKTMAIFAVLFMAPASTFAQQRELPCTSFDANTGTAVCHGVLVNVYKIACGSAYSSQCMASVRLSSGVNISYYFRGLGSGLPSGYSIRPDCSSTEFPYNGGIAMARALKAANGTYIGCHPEADTAGTTLMYVPTTNPNEGQRGIGALMLTFGPHKSPTGITTRGAMRITCEAGKTADFRYTLTPTGAAEILTAADCISGSEIGYRCEQDRCVVGEPGVPLSLCQRDCGIPQYICKADQCVYNATGTTLQNCQSFCA